MTTPHFKTPRITPILLLLGMGAGLGGCANGSKISPQNRAAIRTVQILSPPNGAEGGIYGDKTTGAAAVVGAQFGLIGGFVGGAIAASNIKSGVKRWAPVTGGRQAQVLQLVRGGVEKQFVESGKLRVSAQGPSDARLAFTSITYGVSHGGKQRFHAAVSAALQMEKPDGKVVWKTGAFATSADQRTIQEFQQHPEAYSAALGDAAGQVVRKLVEAY